MKSVKNLLKDVEVNEIINSVSRSWQWFFSYPGARIGLSDLAKSISSSKTSTKEAVEYLLKIGFLTREIIGKAWLLTANQKHSLFISKKIPYNLSNIYESGIVESVHATFPSSRAIVLFGSYRWGTDTENSDIDIAVEVIGDFNLKIINIGIIKEFGYRKNVPVNLHIFSRNKIDLNLFSNIANGIVLDGFLEVKI